jgi:pilus assembly protein CpaC
MLTTRATFFGSHLRLILCLFAVLTAPALLSAEQLPSPQAPLPQVIDSPSQLIHRVQRTRDRVEMVVNSSLILALDSNIPRLQVDNPDLVTLTPLSATQVLIHAKKTGFTNISLWDEQNHIYSIEATIKADSRELTDLLKSEFPGATITVKPTSAGVIVSGYVDRPEDVNRIITLAQDYYPKVLNNIRVGGTPQVILHVKVMEVSRSKLRQLGVDFDEVFNAGFSFFSQSASGLGKVSVLPQIAPPVGTLVSGVGAPTLSAGLLSPNSGFYLFIAALQRNQLLKVLAEPTLVTVSGRPAYFQSGGEIPIPIPQSLGTISIQFRKFGTQVDFVPVVLGNGRIRLEVRPKISQIDNTISVTLNGSTIPGFRTREVDTGVEMMAGQTLALAGLIQTQVETSVQGIPYLMDVPYLGVPFRSTTDTVNEIELLIMVRPELAEPLDCDQVPPVGPAMGTTVPTDCDLYFRGQTEAAFPPPGAGPGPGAGGGPLPGGVGFPPGGPGAGPGVQIETVPPGQPVERLLSPGASRAPLRSRSTVVVSDEYPATSGAAVRTPAQPASDPRYNRARPQIRPAAGNTIPESDPPSFLGPTGYDVVN